MAKKYDTYRVPARSYLAQALAGTAVALGLWYGLFRLVNNPLLPSPVSCLHAAQELWLRGALAADAIASLLRIASALVMALAIATPLGIVSALLSRSVNPLSPIIEALRPVPPIAWLPIALAIFGATNTAAKAIITLGAFFPLYSGSKFAVESIPKNLRDTARLLRWTHWETLRWLFIPGILAQVLTSLQIALGVAWMCVVASEMLGVESGLGYRIELNRQLLRLDNVVVYMLLCSLLGTSCMWGCQLITKIILPWQEHPHSSDKQPALLTTSKHTMAKIEQPVALSIKNLCYAYPNSKRGPQGIHLEIEAGKVHVILGPSGCGKSTLLRLISGTLCARNGTIEWSSSASGKPKVAYMTQDDSLFPWMSAGQQVLRAMPRQARQVSLACAYLRRVGVNNLWNAYPHALSGGQRQRVALARALASQSPLLLLDEPFSHLDPLAREHLQQDLKRICRQTGLTTVVVTHDISEALILGDNISVMNGDGSGFCLHYKNHSSSRSSKEYYQGELLLRGYLVKSDAQQQKVA